MGTIGRRVRPSGSNARTLLSRAGGGASQRGRAPSALGQSVAEFALVLPIMVLILVAVADFARVFTALITVEAAARGAAELTANQYLRTAPSPLPNPGNTAYYGGLNRLAAETACAEAASLPNTDYDPSTGECQTWPAVRVCVHDGVTDNQCGGSISGFSSAHPNCPELGEAMVAAPEAYAGTPPPRYVEVRLCYQFTMLLRIPPLPMGATPPIGDIYIERARTFTVADY